IECTFSIACMLIADSDVAVKVMADLGANVTLPCRLPQESSSFFSIGIRVKWTKVAEDEALNEDVLLSMGFHKKTYGSFEDRVYLQERDSDDASLVITDVSMDDAGTYRCEIINGMVDTIQEIGLEGISSPTGVVFPYSPPLGRYSFSFHEALQACLDQDAVVASYDQLFEAWKGGMDWCNAGWLDDGTVQYPITKPREPCGGANNRPGLRNYGRRDKYMSRFDAFCFSTPLNGHFYWLTQPEKLNFDEAVQACFDDGAEIAKVGHMFSAWKLEGYDRCDAGWLADGSGQFRVHFPEKIQKQAHPQRTYLFFGLF
uniref:Hyaluronan and proteoglycan link protein 1a n=1 Tax=Hippocampus comes TaxID=109280 RepID=A0A3Q2Z419_HIPCM